MKDINIDALIRIALIIGIAAWSFQLLYPLLGILAWAFILSVVLHPFYLRLNNVLGNRPILSATTITAGMLFLIIGITLFVTKDIARSVADFSIHVNTNEQIIPAPPASIKEWPVIGDHLHKTWSAISVNLENELKKHSATLLSTSKYIFTTVLNTGKAFILFVIAIIFSGFLLATSTNSTAFIQKLAKRVSQKNGIDIIKIIKETLQNVSRGVIGIALLQTFIFWLLLLIASAPGAGLLSIIALIFCIAQLGLVLLAIPVIAWLMFTKSLGVALVISSLLIIDTLLDNILKPFVLARGLSTPMTIIFIGVICGILTYGLIGVFIGPVILAIAYDLLLQWVAKEAS